MLDVRNERDPKTNARERQDIEGEEKETMMNSSERSSISFDRSPQILQTNVLCTINEAKSPKRINDNFNVCLSSSTLKCGMTVRTSTSLFQIFYIALID